MSSLKGCGSDSDHNFGNDELVILLLLYIPETKF